MGEIKFRQPILVRGKFGYWHYWGFLSEGQFASPETKQSSINKAKETSQQFTGIHDRNGREIYEGDVVQWDVNRSFSVGVVMFERGYYDLKSLDGERWVCCDWYRGEYEVLGNIYENPELCKG